MTTYRDSRGMTLKRGEREGKLRISGNMVLWGW